MDGRVGLVAVAVVLAALAPTAAAHASLVSSEPTAGSASYRAPDRVTVLLSEAVDADFSTLRVVNAEGVRIDMGDVVHDGASMSVSLPALPRGLYEARWQALSKADGHTTRGVVPFVVGDAALARGYAGGAREEVESGGALEVAARSASYVGLALSAGSVAFGLLVLPRLDLAAGEAQAASRACRRATVAGAALLAAASVGLLLALAARTGDAPLVDLVSGSRSARLLALRAAGAAALAALAAAGVSPRAAQPVAVFGVVAAVAAGSHSAAVESPPHFYAALDALHLVAGSFWVAGLLHVGRLAWRRAAPPSTLVGKFTPYATTAVVLLVLSGVAALLALADPASLPGTEYGTALFVKVGLVVVMVAFGAVHAFGPSRSARVSAWFERTVAVELAAGVAVLVVAGLLTNAAPPSGEAAFAGFEGPPVVRLAGEAGNLTVELVVGPAPLVPGSHRFDVLVLRGGDHSITNVTVELFQPSDRRVETRVVPLDLVSHGEQYGAEGAYLTSAGDWQAVVKVRRTVTYDVKATFALEVGTNEESK